MGNNQLTAKQEEFAKYVAEGETYADAYRKAYSASKQSNNSIWVNSSKLMANTKVKLRVDELRQGTLKRNEVTVDEVLNELASWLRFDPLTIIDEDTECVRKLKDMDKESRMSIAEIQVTELFGSVPNDEGKGNHKAKIGEVKKIKFIDKRATAEMFMKKFGQYVTTVNLEGGEISEIKEILKDISGKE